MTTYQELIQSLETTYQGGITLGEAEKLAAKALFVMDQLSRELVTKEGDRRLRKAGVKAIRAAIRIAEVKKYDKKPTESQLEDVLNTSEIVLAEESAFDSAEVDSEAYERMYSIAKEIHVYYRGVARGSQG